ncbi:MAG TPA: hypothetical protein VFG00_15020 [Acidothermaceae bacterium]|nr:hypothetical protein [Acidothermaceae bacterium]
MDVDLVHFDGCPNWKLANQRLTEINAERPDITVTRHLVDTIDEAERSRGATRERDCYEHEGQGAHIRRRIRR